MGSPVLLQRTRHTVKSNQGFTLAEMVIALAVITVATSILVSMLGHGIALGNHSRHRSAAANIGESILTEIQMRPTAYVWPSFEDLSSGELVEITPTGASTGTAGHSVAAPLGADVVPAGTLNPRRQREFFDGFRWLAHGQRRMDGANHLELTVSIFWTEAGRPQSIALTTAYPRALIEQGA
jgi:prepilin-type N-terminal cleavage/methylation domain-containing protein